MNLEVIRARESDALDIATLVNAAYRGDTGKQGWTTEAHIIGGQRTEESMVREMVLRINSVILLARDEKNGSLFGCVHLEKISDNVVYLGMLTVAFDRQGLGIGDFVLKYAEKYSSQEFEATHIRMTVISVRDELIEWYERRGYKKTGERAKFPYGDERFGKPFTADLEFVVLEKRI